MNSSKTIFVNGTPVTAQQQRAFESLGVPGGRYWCELQRGSIPLALSADDYIVSVKSI